MTKLTDYLLAPGHRVGGPKAAFFCAFGFSADRPDEMAAALIAHPDHNPVERTVMSRWGRTYVVRCMVQTPDGRNPCIVSVWIVPPDHDDARLVTAYPAGT